MGRRKKPEGEAYVFTTLRVPPDLWNRFVEFVPRGERSAVIHRLLRDEVQRMEWLAKQRERRARESEG